MIAITTPTYDLDGVYVSHHHPLSSLNDITRRATRTATLDGGAVMNDIGYSDSDRTITVTTNPSLKEREILSNMVKFYSNVYLFITDGAFNANPNDLAYNRDGTVTVTLLVVSKASE